MGIINYPIKQHITTYISEASPWRLGETGLVG